MLTRGAPAGWRPLTEVRPGELFSEWLSGPITRQSVALSERDCPRGVDGRKPFPVTQAQATLLPMSLPGARRRG
jgi:hypothetical protein